MNPGRPLLADYCRAGWFLVEIPPGKKGPIIDKWNLKEMCVNDPDVAEWMHGNVGLAHAYSGTCAIDIDDMARTVDWMKQRGIDLPALLNAPDAVRIESRPGRGKLLYRISKPLPTCKVSGVFELRCASGNGLTMQDVLPPSIHPDTGQPYQWKYNAAGAHWSKLPPLPPALAVLWASFIKPPAATPTPRAPAVSNFNIDAARRTLALWDPDGGYDEWIMIGMALHFESKGSQDGLALWNEWSSRGKKYKGLADLDFHWRSFRHDHQTPKTLASLRKETAATADEFPDLTKPQPPESKAVVAASKAKREMAEEIIRTLSKSKLGKYEATISNVTSVLSLAEISGHELALDVFLDAIVILHPDTKQWRPLTDTDYTALRVWLETIGNCEPVNHETMRHAVHLVAEQQQMDSARAWLEGIQWDGVPRVEHFCSRYFGTEDSRYTRRVSEYLWTALAGRVLSPGCQADMVPVLIGPQGVGKSRGVMAMSPDPQHFAEVRVDEPDDTIARKMRGVLVAELAEMRGMRAADVERIKAFITRTHEKWVPKYKEFAITYPRRFIMVGTTNDEEFLPMDTEHRRWLPLSTTHVDVAGILHDREQLWAEGATRFAVEGIAWQGLDILAQPARTEAAGVDNWTDDVAAWLAGRADQDAPVRLNDVMHQAVGLDPRTINRTHELRAARILRALGYAKRNTRVGGRVQKAWLPDPLS